MPTTLTFERQKMSVEIWEKLKNHIMRQREKRKQEQEQDAEQERHRREQELKRKRDATTLEDIKDQLSKLDTRLSELKKEKHELFLQLKKVLNEDEIRKKQKESEILAVHQAIHAQQQNNKYNPFLMANSNYLNNSRMPPNQISLQQQQQLQQQLLSKHSPITTGSSLSTPTNYINTVITQSSSMPTHQQQPQQMTNKRSAGVKRPLERSSPQPNVPYTGILPIYKTSMSFTPTVPRIATTSQVFYPPNRHLSIPVSQPSISSGQINFDSKNNPYQFIPGVIPGVDANTHDQVTAAAVNAVNSGQLSSQQISQIQQQQQDFYQQQLRGLAAGLQPTLMSIQNNQLKQGGITAGFPVNRPGMPPNTTGQANNNQVPGRQFSNRFIY